MKKYIFLLGLIMASSSSLASPSIKYDISITGDASGQTTGQTRKYIGEYFEVIPVTDNSAQTSKSNGDNTIKSIFSIDVTEKDEFTMRITNYPCGDFTYKHKGVPVGEKLTLNMNDTCTIKANFELVE